MQVWDSNQFFIPENNFIRFMDSVGEEFRKKNYWEGFFDSFDGAKIHYTYLENPMEHGAVVISHGFCEFIGKYDEMIYYLYNAGYSVYFMDHRGHGYSFRYVNDDWGKVHMTDMNESVEDLKIFVDTVVKKFSPKTDIYLVAHSMGGAIGALFLEKYPDVFKKAVLSSPMIAMSTGKFPSWMVYVITVFAKLFGNDEKYIFGKHGFDDIPVFPTSSMLSEERYDYTFRLRREIKEYQTYGATFGWTRAGLKASKELMKNAGKIKTHLMLMQAGKDTMVRLPEQNRFVEQVKGAKLLTFPNSKHEIFNSIEADRMEYYRCMLDFLNEEV